MRVALQSAIKYSWRNGSSALRRHSLLLIGTLTPFLIFFGPIILSGKFLIAGDVLYQSYALRTVAWSQIASGQLPLWTPSLFSGYPLLAMAQVAIGYPLTWLYLILPGHWAEQIVTLAPFILTPIFTYAYTRELGRSQLASVLAGLAFTYGGNISSKLGGLSPAANSELWLPLLLLAIERARRKDFIPCLIGAATAYAMAILAGHAQGFLLVGALALAYATFTTALGPREEAHGSFARWRPLFVAVGGMSLAAGVAAFQIFETLESLRNSVRSTLTYGVFTAGAFTPREALFSFLAPPYHYIEVSTYVAPLVCGLAIIAVLKIAAANERAHIIFWSAVAVMAFVLMLGDHTPIYRALYQVPVFNLFRYPSRHAFEWSFALSVLSAFGFDALIKRETTGSPSRKILLGGLTIAWVFVAGSWWQSSFSVPHVYNFGLDSGLIPTAPESHYLLWKLAFTAVIALLFWQGLREGPYSLLIVVLLAVCFEAHLFLSHVWFPFAKSSTSFTTTPPVSNWLQQQSPEQKRIYTRVNLFVRGYSSPPPVDLPNMTAVRGLQNVAGYEQLIMDRYSRALGNVGPDAVNLRYDLEGPPDDSLLTNTSHVLDLLNTHYVVGFTNFATAPEDSIEKDGIRIRKSDLGSNLLPGQALTLTADTAFGDTLVLVTSLGASVEVAQGAKVADINVVTVDGKTIPLELQAGRDSAEWAHERPDVRSLVKHGLAPVFDEQPTSDSSHKALRFWTRLSLGSKQQIQRVEIKNVTQNAQLAIWKATLYDSPEQHSATLGIQSQRPLVDHLVPVFREAEVVVWQNHRALPRAWLVSKAETVDGDEALRRIRGESKVAFDPTQTVLLETNTERLPAVDNNLVKGSCKLTAYESNYLAIETETSATSVLVVSEPFYPGWEARIDGVPSQIFRANYLLRGVVVPAGGHKVEMQYRAPAARKGAYISCVAILILLSLLGHRYSPFSRRR